MSRCTGYRKLDALSQSERDFSACTFNSGDVFTCGGSSTTAPGRFQPNDGGNYTIDANGNFIPYSAARDAYNFAPTNYYQRPDERYTAGVFGHYDVSDKVEVYSEFMFMDDRTIAQIAPSGAFYGSGPGTSNAVPDGSWLVNCDNPFLSASQRTAICQDTDGNPLAPNAIASLTMGRRNVEGGARQDDLGHTSYRGVIGSRGDITDHWSFDVYGMFGTTRLSENFQNDVSSSRLNTALQAVLDPLTGNIVCAANANGANGAPGCAPYNIWQPGGVTPEALAYIQTPGFQEGWAKETVVSGSITGNLTDYGIRLPTASDGLGVAFGAEYRKEETDLRVDEKFYTNDLAGQGSATLPMSGQFDVRELFAEARLPILQDLPFAQSLSAEPATGTPITIWASTRIPTSSAWTGRRPATFACAAVSSTRCAHRICRNCSCRRKCSWTAARTRAPGRLSTTRYRSISRSWSQGIRLRSAHSAV